MSGLFLFSITHFPTDRRGMTDLMSGEFVTFYRLGVGLAIGLLLGVERGWKEREAKEGERIAGVRTYGLIGLLGGAAGLLSIHVGPLATGLVFIGLAGVLVTAHVWSLGRAEDIGITSLVAQLLTFGLGALAAVGEVAVAAASAVVATWLLSSKSTLHRWLRALEGRELRAGIQLLLMSVVLLPILPNQGYGPWQVLNPYAIWWMVVLIAAISFIGYFSIKIGGAGRGAAFTGVFGGLASSTALTLHFSRASRRQPRATPMLAIGILLACGTMFPRMLVVASALNPDLLRPLLVPALVMALLVYVPAGFYWRLRGDEQTDMGSTLRNPLELKSALTFGALLGLVMLLGKALETWFGDAGVLGLAAASGLADVDAITLSLARMTEGGLALPVAAMGVVIAAAVNSLAKGVMAAAVGGREIGIRVGLPLLASAAGGLAVAWLWLW